MKNTLQIEHIAKRLPYGLNFLIEKRIAICIDRLESVHAECITFNKSPDWYFDSQENETDIKPILFPLSSLTETITIKGKELIPLLELAKIEDKDCNYLADDENGLPIIGYDHNDFDMGSMSFAHTYRFEFDAEIGMFVFNLYDEGNTKEDFILLDRICKSNRTLLEKLLEWHFDLPNENLIEQGLAISVFDLTENPYA